MSEILLTGLRAGTPIGFLAALGAFRHATEMTDVLGNVRLSWANRGGEWLARLTADGNGDAEQFLEAFVHKGCAIGARPEFEWAEQIKKNSPEDFHRAIDAAPECTKWFVAFGSEMALANDGTLRSTYFDMTGGQQKFLLKLREASAALCGSPKEANKLLLEALFGPWLYSAATKGADAENSHSMGLDPSTLLEGAFTAAEPAGIKDKRGVRGAIWLAFEALPLFPCALVNGYPGTVGFERRKEEHGTWKTFLEWGVWETPLTLAALQILLIQSREEWTRGRGITQRFRSERANLNKDYFSLAPAELVTN